MLQFRQSTIADVRVLAELRADFTQELNPGLSPEERAAYAKTMRAYLAEAVPEGRYLAWLAEEDGKVVSTAGATIYRMPPRTATAKGIMARVTGVYTLPSSRGRGIARALFPMLMDTVRAAGAEYAYLNATDMGRGLYTDHGFTDVHNEMGIILL